jgi:hypothetical protein
VVDPVRVCQSTVSAIFGTLVFSFFFLFLLRSKNPLVRNVMLGMVVYEMDGLDCRLAKVEEMYELPFKTPGPIYTFFLIQYIKLTFVLFNLLTYNSHLYF